MPLAPVLMVLGWAAGGAVPPLPPTIVVPGAKSNFLFSGEILPIAPRLSGLPHDVKSFAPMGTELDVFHRKLLDYLRRLTGKLSSAVFTQGFGGGGPESLALVLNADQPTNAFFTPVAWNTTVRINDSIYTHAVDGSEITVKAEGLYIVILDFLISPDILTLFEVKITSPVYLELLHSFAESYSGGTLSMCVPAPLLAGDIIEIEVRDNAGSPRQLQKIGTRLTMFRLQGGTTPTKPGSEGCPGGPLWQFTPPCP